jgi:hypothetical protein
MSQRVKPERRSTSQPVKISKERIDAILKDISELSTYYHAAEANGIAYTTFYWWVRQGQCDLRYGIDSIYSYLVKALREIEQEEIKDCRKRISLNEKGHMGAQWTLEHSYWKQFGSNAQLKDLSDDFELEKGAYEDEKHEKGSEESGEERSKTRAQNDEKIDA